VSHSDLSDTSENNLRTEGKQGSENRGQKQGSQKQGSEYTFLKQYSDPCFSAFVVARSEEARLPVVAALHDMLRNMRKIDARSAWHLAAGSSRFREFAGTSRRGL